MKVLKKGVRIQYLNNYVKKIEDLGMFLKRESDHNRHGNVFAIIFARNDLVLNQFKRCL